MNVFGIDLLQLIIYVCVGASLIVVVYILKLTRNKNKPKTRSKKEPEPSEETPEPTLETKDETIKQLVTLIDKMWSHQVGVSPNPNSCSNPDPPPPPPPTPSKKGTRKKKPEIKELPPQPTQSHSIQQINEETYTSTTEDKEVLENIRKQLGEGK